VINNVLLLTVELELSLWNIYPTRERVGLNWDEWAVKCNAGQYKDNMPVTYAEPCYAASEKKSDWHRLPLPPPTPTHWY